MSNANFTTPEILHDAPLGEGDKFYFNFDEYAATISRLIALRKTKTPLAICVSGAWGAGKTTLLRRIKMMLDKTGVLREQTEPELLDFANPEEYPRKTFRFCRTVWFNAWKYSDEDELLIALIRIILQEMAEDTVVTRLIAKLLDPAYPRRDVVNTVLNWFKIKLPQGEIGLDTGTPIPTQFSEKTAILDLFDEAFDRLMAAWIHGKLNSRKTNPQNGVLVIFIDDLDRCLPVKMVQVLEAIKLFLDKKGCVFILGADTVIVQQAIVKHYEDAGVTGENAKDYLDKIVQLRFELPPVIEKNMKGYLKKEGVSGDDWGESWKLLLMSANFNPRSVKAFVNDINLQWSMLVNLGQTNGMNRSDFNTWQVLMRTAPPNFVRHIRVRLYDSTQRHKYILDAIAWAKGDPEYARDALANGGVSLDDKFSEYSNDYRLRRVLQEITFSHNFTGSVIDAFIHLMAPAIQDSKASRIMTGSNTVTIYNNFSDESAFSRKDRKLKVFISYASADLYGAKPLYQRLSNDGFSVWFDSDSIMPGQNWEVEITKAIKNTDVVIICLSRKSESYQGFAQKEMRMALDIAREVPEGDVYIIPVRLEECQVPQNLLKYQWVDLFREEEVGYQRLLRALRARADSLGIKIQPSPQKEEKISAEDKDTEITSNAKIKIHNNITGPKIVIGDQDNLNSQNDEKNEI